jgi:hypothetical protein
LSQGWAITSPSFFALLSFALALVRLALLTCANAQEGTSEGWLEKIKDKFKISKNYLNHDKK